jgi:hypothetical protein
MSDIERKRDKHREISTKPFESMVPADNHRIERFTTNSLYAGLSLGGQLKHLELLEVGTPERKSHTSFFRKSNSRIDTEKSTAVAQKVLDQVSSKDGGKHRKQALTHKLSTRSI